MNVGNFSTSTCRRAACFTPPRLKTYFRTISVRTLILFPLFLSLYSIRAPSNSSPSRSIETRVLQAFSFFFGKQFFAKSFLRSPSFPTLYEENCSILGAPVGWQLYKGKLYVNSPEELLIETNEKGDLWRDEVHESLIESSRNNEILFFFLPKRPFVRHTRDPSSFYFFFVSRIKIGILNFHLYPVDYEELRDPSRKLDHANCYINLM